MRLKIGPWREKEIIISPPIAIINTAMTELNVSFLRLRL